MRSVDASISAGILPGGGVSFVIAGLVCPFLR